MKKAVIRKPKTEPQSLAGGESPTPEIGLVLQAGPLPCLGSGEIDRLFQALGQANLPERTRKLMAAHLPKKAKKLMEEAAEMGLDAVLGNRKGMINESVDVLYHLIVLWRSCGIKPDAVWEEMNRRANDLGVSEKLPKTGIKGGKPKPV